MTDQTDRPAGQSVPTAPAEMGSPGGTGNSVSGSDSGATDAAREKALEATEQAKEKAGQAKEVARGRVRDEVDRRSTDAGARVSAAASDARAVSEELRNRGDDAPAKLAEQAADYAEQVGDYLQRSDGDTILRDVEDLARRQPALVIVGGLALGFVAARFLKASSQRRYGG